MQVKVAAGAGDQVHFGGVGHSIRAKHAIVDVQGQDPAEDGVTASRALADAHDAVEFALEGDG